MTKTTTATSTRPIVELPDEDAVIAFLRQNPGVLERHPEVIANLTFSHESGSAISLVERQLRVLRDENQKLKTQLNNLVHVARENEELSQRFHRLSLELMSSDNLHDIVAMTRNQVQTFFYTDVAEFCFLDRLRSRLPGLEKSVLDPESKHATKIRNWVNKRQPVFGPLDPGVRKLLFGEHANITSCVLIPLYHSHDIGLLLLGSKSRDRFIDGMGTIFLSQLGELVSHKISQFLD